MDLMDVRREMMGVIAGMTQGNSDIHWGTFTKDQRVSSDYSFSHGFSTKPRLVIIYVKPTSTNQDRVMCIRDEIGNNNVGAYGKLLTNANTIDISSSQNYAIIDNTNITLTPASTPWAAGEYTWIAIK